MPLLSRLGWPLLDHRNGWEFVVLVAIRGLTK